MNAREEFKSYLESQSPRKTGKASSYVRALDLLSEMLAAKPKGFEDCVDIWNVSSATRLQELYEVANDEKHRGAKSAWNLKGIAPSYLQDGYCTAALREFQSFLLEGAHYQKLMSTFRQHTGNTEDLAKKLNRELAYPKALVKSMELDGKETLRERATRVNQSVFRTMILHIYGNACCITGLDLPQVNKASHILGWAESKPTRMDPRNGLCLSATYDVAFDRHLISLDEDFRILVSKDITEHFRSDVVRSHFHKRQGQIITLPQHFRPLQTYLEQHRSNGRF